VARVDASFPSYISFCRALNTQHKDFKAAAEMGEETLDRYINYCYCKEIAVDRWKGTPSDPHELSERIATMLSLMTANVKSERITL
jgi:hypothetical protein